MSQPAATFLDATRDLEGAASVIVGLPYDGGVSYRAGASLAPEEIRRASQSIETYSPRLRKDLEDLAYADAGDLDLAGTGAEVALGRIADAVEAHLRAGRFVVGLGGDHSVSIGTSAGARRVHPGLAHVVFDAHLDLRSSYGGSALSHACGTRHLAEAGPTALLGVRSGSRDEFAEADTLLVHWSEGLELPVAARARFEGRPVLVSVDLDVLDPSVLPGTGSPEPAGHSYRELREAVLALAGLEIVALDLVEVAPLLDPSGLSAVVAAELTRDFLLGLGPGQRG